MQFPVTGLYAGILGLILLFLGLRVSGERMKSKSSIGLNDTPTLHEAIR